MFGTHLERHFGAILPAANTSGGMSAAEALCLRRSQRSFTAAHLSIAQVSQLCWAAQGITDAVEGFRTAPSAGGLFPITVFVIDEAGVSRYDAARHRLVQVVAGDIRPLLQTAAFDQACVGSAPVCLALAVDVEQLAPKYGHRAERYCLLEAGHVAQNVLLQATALGLVAVPVGAFDDERVADLLSLPEGLEPVYLLPVGHPVVC